MDSDRPHRSGSSSSSSSELFICFTSRFSSSMKISLKHNGSVKKASPMFSTGGNKNPEPSSPKVTCIGQVRVKTKKQRQRRHSEGEQQSICEALRSIGAEFSCLLPCKSSCFSSGERDNKEARSTSEQSSYREIQFVDDDDDDDEVLPVRRHVFDNLEIEDLIPKMNKVGQEEGRMSICVPPKNALLLMRCRSDPLKMADLTNRFWDSSVHDDEEFEVIDEKRDSVDSSVILEAESKLKMEILENNVEELQPVIEQVENQLIDSSISDLKGCENEIDNAIEEENNTEEPISEKQETVFDERERESQRKSKLPDCLLLMMCEPKLSMEVSRETWVCSTDFMRWQPEKRIKKVNGQDEPKKPVLTDNPEQTQPQPSPEPVPDVSMATEIEKKLVNAVGCEPFVLTRCKSAPMRAPCKDSSFWINRNLEPHRRSSVGFSTAGVGF